MEDFVFVGGCQPPPHDRFLAAAARWDDDALHLAYRPAASLVPVTKTQRDDDIFNECMVEIFIAAGAGFCQIEVNPLGAVLDLYCPVQREEQDRRTQARWDAEGVRWAVRAIQSPAEQSSAGWMAVLSLPWSAIPEATRESFDGVECLRVNLCRCQRRADGRSDLTSRTPAREALQ